MEIAQSWIVVQDKIDFSPKFTLSVQYGHEWDEPKGITGQFQRNDLQGKVEYKVFRAQDQCSFLRAVTASLSETWRSDGYIRTALSSSTCPGCARSDNTHQLVFALSIPNVVRSVSAECGCAGGKSNGGIFSVSIHNARFQCPNQGVRPKPVFGFIEVEFLRLRL